MVLHGEQSRRSSNGSSGNNSNTGGAAKGGGTATSGGARPSKKAKQVKIPQRGLGVAELERILRDQQQSSNGPSALCSSSTAGMAAPPLSAASDPNFMLRAYERASHPATAVPSNLFVNGLVAPPPPPPSQASAPCAGMAPGVAGTRSVFDQAVSPAASGGLGLPGPRRSDSTVNPMWWYPTSAHRRPPHHQAVPMVNVPVSPSSSSGVHLQMEPPSNQISFSSSNSSHGWPPWHEGERTVGVKRQWSHPFENSPVHSSVPFRTPQVHDLEAYRSEPRDPNTSPRCSQADQSSFCGSTANRGKSMKDNGGELLSLGPPAQSSSTAATTSYRPMPAIPHPNHHELPRPFSPPSRNAADCDDETDSRRLAGEPFYDFLPTKPRVREDEANKRGGGAEDAIDLQLKL